VRLLHEQRLSRCAWCLSGPCTPERGFSYILIPPPQPPSPNCNFHARRAPSQRTAPPRVIQAAHTRTHTHTHTHTHMHTHAHAHTHTHTHTHMHAHTHAHTHTHTHTHTRTHTHTHTRAPPTCDPGDSLDGVFRCGFRIWRDILSPACSMSQQGPVLSPPYTVRSQMISSPQNEETRSQRFVKSRQIPLEKVDFWRFGLANRFSQPD